MRSISRVRRLSALVQLSALALAACGGGGGGSPAPEPVATAPTSAPSAGGPAAPAPAPSASTTVTGDIVAAANTAYTVNAAGPVTITLPATAGLKAGDTVSVTGMSATAWQIAQNAGQSILTHSLAGGVASGTNWTAATVGPQVWHWLSSDAAGDVLVAGETAEGMQGGRLRLSTDAGQTWTTPATLPAGVWISSDLSADGSRIVAVQFQGGMYLSTDRGATWTQVTASQVNRVGGFKFESVTMSRDGMHLAATIRDASDTQPGPGVGNGSLLISNDGGTTWTTATLPATTQPKVMRAVDSSADGQVIVAVSQGGDVFRSTDGGATPFTLVPIAVGTPPVAASENWYRVKTSADGKTIAVAANSIETTGTGGTGIYVSRDGGATWTKGLDRRGDYTAIAMSDDGTTIAATISNPNPNNSTLTTPGQVVRSTDAGATFQPLTMPAGTTDWRAIAMSFEGDRLAVAAGFFLTGEAGPLELSAGSRTTAGTAGGIGGGNAGASLQVRYLGFGTFDVVGATGSFTPH